MTMSQIILETMTPDHLDGAVVLSKQAGWPHRRDDWALVLALSNGFVALEDGLVVGTAMATPLGDDVATINMVIVDEAMRGRGLGRKLMQAALDAASGRTCLLVATQDGLPLYEKLGFVANGEIIQHQGVIEKVDSPEHVVWARADDFPRLVSLDHQATGIDRATLMQLLSKCAKFAVIQKADQIEAFAAIREFGRGQVIGPIVAKNDDDARSLIDFLLSDCIGQFVRIDTSISTDLGIWLTERGLVHVGGGITMRRAERTNEEHRDTGYRTYALVNQALG
ncbi:acetyltransferase family protein (plasmid) [Ochrobactrum quorumnocens]|uniref:Acetyltransferase family protein n=1 Tax=Ochrobactrum quorumnocens TaxID=271865 RepID=A0A248UPG0_9HYPH|nr:GNAT family N-acetyltransferase [[Ochrobactrum] quorumnocens]ASV88271.1 acetyltransferase family protein [[Ochrobactrum] quorumnocens]